MIDKSKASEVIKFIETLHFTGDFHGQKFKLQGWQLEIINAVYGTVTEKGNTIQICVS